jgi:hypothetical protein
VRRVGFAAMQAVLIGSWDSWAWTDVVPATIEAEVVK